MQTILEHCRAVGSSAYYGENGNWLIAYSVSRGSDCLSRSNFEVFQKRLKALPEVKDWSDEFSPVLVERFDHWACGWIDYLIVDPACKSAVELAASLLEKLDDYPVLDENDWSEKEQEEANTVWRDCYGAKERIAYVRKFRRRFEFHDFRDMLNCCRGKYFAGYAGELIS